MSEAITLQASKGHLAQAEFSVAIVPGDTVTLTAAGATAILCFGDETAEILSPAPTGPVTLGDGDSVVYTFGPAAPGSYPVVVVGSSQEIPAVIDFEAGGTAVLKVSVRGGGRGLGDDTGSGT